MSAAEEKCWSSLITAIYSAERHNGNLEWSHSRPYWGRLYLLSFAGDIDSSVIMMRRHRIWRGTSITIKGGIDHIWQISANRKQPASIALNRRALSKRNVLVDKQSAG